jgi:hypothetical protein
VLISFGSDMSGVRLNTWLEACLAHGDDIAVGSLLQQLLTAELDPEFVAAEPWIRICENGFRTLRALRTLKEHHLRDMGFSMGDASAILDVVQPTVVYEPAHVTQIGNGAGGEQAAVRLVPVKVGPMRSFPPTNAAGYPDANGW